MSSINIFERAARAKIRFQSSVGLITTEDLFSLPLISKTGKPNLDDVAKAVDKEIRNSSETKSFVNPEESSDNEIANLKMEIVKHVIATRMEERDKAAGEEKRRAEKQQILRIIDEKENEELKGKSLEELREIVQNMK